MPMEAALRDERFRIRGMHCANCALTIENAVREIPGVRDANVNFAAETLSVRAAQDVAPGVIEDRVARAGYRAIEAREGAPTAGESTLDRIEARRNLLWVIASAGGAAALMALNHVPARAGELGQLAIAA